MKKVFTLVLLIQISLGCFAQLWNEKSLLPQPHLGEVSFSIDSLGYVYTGDATNNFYCYNPSTNTWAPKANFPGVARAGAAGFAIGSNGYVGSGISTVTNGLYYKDFYQYNPSTDSWTSKAAYPDSTTLCAGFTLGSHGYQWGATRKFYQYDPVTDLWAQKANVPSNFSFATSVLGKGYAVRSNQIWEYDSLLDTWTQRANSNSTIGGKGFTLDNKLYMPNSDSLRIFDPASNSWSGTISFPLAPFTPGPLVDGEFASFAIGGLGYVLETKCTSHFWQLDPSHYFIFNSFSPDTICSGDTVTFYFTTNIHFDSSNYFKFQNAGQVLGAFGNFGSSYNTIDSFPSLGGDTVTFRMTRSLGGNSFGLTRSFAIFSTNPPGQTAYDLQTLTLKAGPTSTLPGSYNFCVGKKVILSYSANSSFHYFWSDSTGLIGTKSSDTVSPAYPVTYYLRVIDTLTGCTQYDTTVAMPHGIPAPGLPDTVYNICPSALLSLGGTAVSGYIYRWTDGNGFNSALASPTVSPTISDTYNLTVTDTTSSSRCSATASVNVTTKQSPAQTLCMVSVDSASSHNIIVWEKLDKTATDSFYLLREMSTNNYVQIAAVPRDSLSEFEDYGADPNVTAYRYKIMVKDTCGNESTLSHYHNSIHLQYLGAGELIWNVYEIENETTPVSTFDVYRDSTGTGSNWALMVTVPGTQATATDINFNLNPGTIYQIHANWSYSCTPSRSALNAALSNIVARNFVTGVSNTENNSISVYPNPASTQLYVQTGNTQFEHISIYDAKGQKVIEQLNTLQPVDISKLEAGIYFVEAKNDGAIARKKFVKL